MTLAFNKTALTIAALAALSFTATSFAHGPQMPLTVGGNGSIITHGIEVDAYPAATAASRAFAFDLFQRNDVSGTQHNGWYVNSNFNGPGIAWGESVFQDNYNFVVTFNGSAKVWDGAAFVSTGGEQVRGTVGGAFSGTFPNYILTDGPTGGTGVTISAGTVTEESHSSIRWSLVDAAGAPTGTIDDGIYLASLTIDSTQPGVEPSLPYYFLLSKNGTTEAETAALNFVNANIVPEPATASVLMMASLGALARRRRQF